MSSSPNSELLKVDLDTAQAESKVRNLIASIGQLAATDPKTTDTTAMVEKIKSEAEAITKSTGTTREAQLTVDALVRSKEKLVSVVSLLGGRFGGMAGQLGNVVQLFMELGSAAALPVGLVAAVTAATAAYELLAGSIQKVIEAKDKLAEREKTETEKGIALEDAVAKERASIGLYGDSLGAAQRINSLQRQGWESGLAHFAVNAGDMLGGLSPEDQRALMAGYLVSGQQAGFTGDIQKDRAIARRLLERGRGGDAQRALQGYYTGTSNSAIIDSLGVDLSGGFREAEIKRLVADRHLSAEDERVLRRAMYPDEHQPAGGFDAGVAGRRFLREIFEPKGSEDANRAIDTEGAALRSMDRTSPTQTIVINRFETSIGTVYNGARNVYADPTSSATSRAPGAAGLARSQ